MVSKTVSLKEETYRRLTQEKGEDESFSDVIDRLLAAEDQPLFELVGLLDDDALESLEERSQSFRAAVEDRVRTRTDR